LPRHKPASYCQQDVDPLHQLFGHLSCINLSNTSLVHRGGFGSRDTRAMALGVAQNPPYIHIVFQDQVVVHILILSLRWSNTAAKVRRKVLSLSVHAREVRRAKLRAQSHKRPATRQLLLQRISPTFFTYFRLTVLLIFYV
jgi:hypothetical protein